VAEFEALLAAVPPPAMNGENACVPGAEATSENETVAPSEQKTEDSNAVEFGVAFAAVLPPAMNSATACVSA